MTAEVPAASEQRAALTEAEREGLCICGALSPLLAHDVVKAVCLEREQHVERILADRAAAEDHGLRAAVAAVADWLADKEADMRASYRSGGGQYAEGFRDACDVAETRLRAAIGYDGRGGAGGAR